MPTITTKDGADIFYKDWGTGRPVVFSHGWPLNADAWDPQLNMVAGNGYRGPAGQQHHSLGLRDLGRCAVRDRGWLVADTPHPARAAVWRRRVGRRIRRSAGRQAPPGDSGNTTGSR